MREQSRANSFGLIATLVLCVFCALLGLVEIYISAYQRAGWLGVLIFSLLLTWCGYEVERA